MSAPTQSSWYEHYLRIREGQRNPNEPIIQSFIRAIEKGSPQSEVAVEFPDEFAPSYARLGAAEADTWVNRATRPLFYASHIGEIAEAAIERAADLGLPRVLWALPSSVTKIDERAFKAAQSAFRDLIETVDEGTEDWLCVTAYIKWINACHWATIEAPIGMWMQDLLEVGAICRELELSHRNRRDAMKAKKQNRVLGRQNEGRDETNRERQAMARAKLDYASTILRSIESAGTDSAVAGHIQKKWGSREFGAACPPKPAKKTIQNWMSQGKLSRTRSSAGKNEG